MESVNRQARQQALFKLLEGLSECAWQQNVVTGETWVSTAFWTRLGYDPKLLPISRETARKLLHPADLTLAAEEVQLRRESNEPFEFEVRLRASSGEWRYIRMRGCVIESGDDGNPSVLGGIITDITDQVLAARTRSEAQDLIAALSTRELQVLNCLVTGAANKNIAYALGLSQRTVEAYRARLMDKMGVRGVGDLVQIALSGGITRENAGNCSPPL
jgi:DNA-binding CsgD family transcriptional regulator